jgi:hypothetical protein
LGFARNAEQLVSWRFPHLPLESVAVLAIGSQCPSITVVGSCSNPVDGRPGHRGADDVQGGDDRDGERNVELVLAEGQDEPQEPVPLTLVVGAPAGRLELGDPVGIKPRLAAAG